MHSLSRTHHRIMPALVVAWLVACAGPSGSQEPTTSPIATGTARTATPQPTTSQGISPIAGVKLEKVLSGLRQPIGITNAGDGTGRLFVNEQGGRVRVIEADGTLREQPFVDISDRVVSGGEQGLLGLAFHPGFARNGRLFVHYSRANDGATVISELTAAPDHESADPGSERVIFTLKQPFPNHNGGQLAFGPDGYLYVGLGDGGSGGDPFGNGQNRGVLLGKILRIDVDSTPAAGKAYAIPPTNPYAAGGISPGAGLPEIWAFGLRNPWRFSFDRATHDLYIGDVGQNAWEEVDRQPAGSAGGENYGWDIYEGTHCSTKCDSITPVAPVAEYSHGEGCAVTGGYVYRGTRQPSLLGTYLFSDYCSGTIWTLPEAGVEPRQLAATDLRVTAFGEAEDGEVYLVDLADGGLYRVVAI